jgi:hypothetical protein
VSRPSPRAPALDELRACEPDQRSRSLTGNCDSRGRASDECPLEGSASSRTMALTSAHTSAHGRSRVEHELALRPGFSVQVLMPPTALPAPRGERPGLLVLTAGPVPYFYGRHPTGPVTAPLSDRPLGGSRPLPSRADPPEGRKGVRP